MTYLRLTLIKITIDSLRFVIDELGRLSNLTILKYPKGRSCSEWINPKCLKQPSSSQESIFYDKVNSILKYFSHGILFINFVILIVLLYSVWQALFSYYILNKEFFVSPTPISYSYRSFLDIRDWCFSCCYFKQISLYKTSKDKFI